jgi:FlaA1/EpsC-like NDP-sugar epimerase
MKRLFLNNPKLNFIIGDVRDYISILDACKNVDYVFHLAALKHVPICEDQPLEALKTNVTGTENIIRASILQNVKKVVDVSSDKAVDPINLYGLTKALGEKLVIQANSLSENTRFVCIRGGNVLGTNGSVVPLFKRLIVEGQEIPITSTDMTRFFLTISDAIQLLLTAALHAVGGETFVMKMKSCKITDLASVLVENLSQNSSSYKDIGIRPGEKVHELLISEHESPYTHEYDKDYYVILPTHSSSNLLKQYNKFPKVIFKRYESSSNLMTKDEIKSLLVKGGFLN